MHTAHIAHMLRDRAAKYGQKEVFRYKEGNQYKSLSWVEFISYSEAISKFLLFKGIEEEDNVGIYSRNMPEWTIADLGSLSIRAVVVPIYATNTKCQLDYVVNHTEMKVMFVGEDEQFKQAYKVLNESNSLELIITFDCKEVDDPRVVSYKEILKKTLDEKYNIQLESALACVRKDDVASIIYTSGTSGEPKGAMLTHSNFLQSFKIHEGRLTINEDDVSACFLPLSHIFERAWTFLLLYNGGINVYNRDPRAIFDELPTIKPTLMCVVPRVYEKVYDGIMDKRTTSTSSQIKIFDWALNIGYRYSEYKKEGRLAPPFLALQRRIARQLVYNKVRAIFGGKIKYMPCAGSAMSSELRKFFHALDIFVVYGYGATETLATVSCMRMDKYDLEYTGDIMPEVDVKISDEGMILVKGDTVFKGYYKKPAETIEVLKDGWYYTGDAGSIPEPGKLLMTERIKDIIKTSTGKMVSPQKIELILMQSTYIEQICVIGDNRKYLSALIVPDYEKVKKVAKKENIKYKSNEELTICHFGNALVMEDIHLLQKDLPQYEKVVKVTLLPEAFTIDNMMLTNSMKIRRKKVNEIYATEINNMYS